MSIRCNLLSAKKPTEALSGDQNGYDAPSAPGSGFATTESSDLTQSWLLLLFDATNANRRPSGERANENGSAVGGVFTSTRISGGAGGVASHKPTAATAVTSVATADTQGHMKRP